MARNKIIFGSEVLIDLTSDTVSASTLSKGVTAHDASGEIITGTNDKDLNTSEATATAGEILIGSTAGIRGAMVTGTMPNNGSKVSTISTKAQSVSIQQGYHDGSGKVSISTTEQAKIIAGNIKSGVSILGVTGTYGGETVKAQAKTATPKTTAQTILPDSGYDYLSQVTVAKIPYTETSNSAGGITVTIG